MNNNVINRPVFYALSLKLARILPQAVMRWLLKNLAVMVYAFGRGARRNVETNVAHVCDDPVEIRRITKRIFANYGTYLADWAKFINMDSQQVLSRFSSIRGSEIFQDAQSRGKGVILLAAHLGNWELGGIFFGNSGMPINILTANDQINEIAGIRTFVRKLHNVKTITIGDDPFFFVDIVNALRRNEIIAMLIDRYERNNGVLIDFFGEPAYFPPGPVLLAKSTGCTVLPAFTVLGEDGKYITAVGENIDMEFSDDKEKDISTNLRKIVKIFEGYIREYCDQWYNFTPIWSKNTPQQN